MNTQTIKKTGQLSEQTKGGITLNSLKAQNTNDNVERLGLTDKIEAFPQELKDLDRWCNWMYETFDGEEKKMPYDSKSRMRKEGAKANNESTWSSFETAKNRMNSYLSMGIYLKKPYVGVDLDNVEDEIKRHMAGDYEDNIVSEFIHELDSYTEISPSGTGIHILIKGDLPKGRRHYGDVEMYDGGRYFTVTFNSIGPDYIRDDHDTGKVAKLHKKYMPAKEVRKRSKQVPEGEIRAHGLSDVEVINRAKRSKQGEKIKTLLAGDWGKYEEYPSQSEADMALANMLAFWTAKDKGQMDRIFRESGLMREKWDEMRGHDTYGNIVLDEAIAGTDEVYGTRIEPAKTYIGNGAPMSIGGKTRFKDTWRINQDEPTLEDSSSFPLRSADDTGNAERLIDRYGDIMRYDFNREKFYVYNGQVWAIDNIGQARRLVNHTVDSIEDEDWLVGKETPFTEEEEKAQEKIKESKSKHITRSRSRASKTNMLELAQTYIPVSDKDFDKEDHLFNTENGYVDLRTGELMRSDKDQMFSMMANTKVDKAAKPTRWLKFLDDVFDGDQEIIDYAQRAVGYSLSGKTSEQSLFILFGNGNNGKTVFVETIRDVVGTYTKNIGASSLGIKPNTANTNDFAKLSGIRMVTSSEPNNGFRFDEGLIKQITGDEVMTARFLFKEEFDYMPQFKLWLTTNYKPIIVGTDDGIWRRLKIIPFSIKIKEEDIDDDLKEKLLEESEGILNWAIEGAVEWFANGLQTPDSIKAETDQYRKQMNILEEFINDECQIGEGLEVKASELWERYKYWSDNNRYDSINRNEFGERMSKAYDRKRKSSGNHYIGLELV